MYISFEIFLIFAVLLYSRTFLIVAAEVLDRLIYAFKLCPIDKLISLAETPFCVRSFEILKAKLLSYMNLFSYIICTPIYNILSYIIMHYVGIFPIKGLKYVK